MSEKTLASSIRFNSLLLAAFAVITTGILAFTNASTKPKIEEQKARAQLAALSEILPQQFYDNDLLNDGLYEIPASQWQQLNLSGNSQAYIAKKNGKPVAIIFPTNGTGYSGKIGLLVGVFANGTIAGVRVTQHAETPGLGDYIDIRKSDWITTFDGKSLSNPAENAWDTKKYEGDFDGLTSATITSRGVIHQVKAALEYFATQHPLQTLPHSNNEGEAY